MAHGKPGRPGAVFAPVDPDPMPEPASLWADGAMGTTDAAEFLGIGRSELWEEIRAGRLDYVKHGTKLLIAKRTLVAWLARKDRTGRKS